MRMAHSLGQQFRESQFWVNISGAPPTRMTPQDLIGDYHFRWLASSQAANQQQRAQQAMTLLQIAPQVLPLLQPLGKTIDPEPLLRRIFSDGFGFRGYNQFVVQAPMPQAMPGAPGMPPGLGMPPSAQGNGIRTANEEGPQMELQPGEGEDFANVRDESEDLAALLGASGGM